MNDDIMVSIYCMAYNHEKYIRQTFEGFLKQNTDFKYEVIVHDDASTDKTAEIIREYEEKYPDIFKAIYQKENQYSKGIKVFDTFIAPVIKGRYVAVCEGDDFWTDAEKLKLQVEFWKNTMITLHVSIRLCFLIAGQGKKTAVTVRQGL